MRKVLFILLLLFGITTAKAQIQTISRHYIMQPISRPQVSKVPFTKSWGRTIIKTKFIPGLDYNVYSKRLIRAALNGDVNAKFALGYIYFNGQGIKADRIKAFNYIKEAADKGVVEAQYRLAICYYYGCGTNKNEAEAIRYAQDAANNGNDESLAFLAWCYLNGESVPQDYKKAVNLYTKAAIKGDARAQTALALMYENGIGVTKDKQKAIKYLQLASTNREAQALFEMGFKYMVGDSIYVKIDAKKGFTMIKEAADKNWVDAMGWTSYFYSLGYGTERNEKKAYEYALKAANEGDAIGQYLVGRSYELGEGVKKNMWEAVRYYNRSASQKNGFGMVGLGECYMTGNGVDQDHKIGFKLFYDAAHLSEPCTKAFVPLGICYEMGYGTEKNIENAKYWYRKAAEYYPMYPEAPGRLKYLEECGE